VEGKLLGVWGSRSRRRGGGNWGRVCWACERYTAREVEEASWIGQVVEGNQLDGEDESLRFRDLECTLVRPRVRECGRFGLPGKRASLRMLSWKT
jgi:hypothetical protein